MSSCMRRYKERYKERALVVGTFADDIKAK
jgi:hypothetical protein